jgi:nicotinate-nucleotide adenylyltransferase
VRAVGILGGTFDPVHNAHLAIAARALEALPLERILWMPTGTPRYRDPPQAAAHHRVAMLGLAIAGEPRYALDARELEPGASGYTYDTLLALRKDFGDEVRLYMLIGSDQYEKLGTWHRAAELPSLATFAVFARPGWNAPAAAHASAVAVPLEPIDVSASEIRARLARGEDVAALLPLPVLDYIRRHHLYGHP